MLVPSDCVAVAVNCWLAPIGRLGLDGVISTIEVGPKLKFQPNSIGPHDIRHNVIDLRKSNATHFFPGYPSGGYLQHNSRCITYVVLYRMSLLYCIIYAEASALGKGTFDLFLNVVDPLTKAKSEMIKEHYDESIRQFYETFSKKHWDEHGNLRNMVIKNKGKGG